MSAQAPPGRSLKSQDLHLAPKQAWRQSRRSPLSSWRGKRTPRGTCTCARADGSPGASDSLNRPTKSVAPSRCHCCVGPARVSIGSATQAGCGTVLSSGTGALYTARGTNTRFLREGPRLHSLFVDKWQARENGNGCAQRPGVCTTSSGPPASPCPPTVRDSALDVSDHALERAWWQAAQISAGHRGDPPRNTQRQKAKNVLRCLRRQRVHKGAAQTSCLAQHTGPAAQPSVDTRSSHLHAAPHATWMLSRHWD